MEAVKQAQTMLTNSFADKSSTYLTMLHFMYVTFTKFH